MPDGTTTVRLNSFVTPISVATCAVTVPPDEMSFFACIVTDLTPSFSAVISANFSPAVIDHFNLETFPIN